MQRRRRRTRKARRTAPAAPRRRRTARRGGSRAYAGGRRGSAPVAMIAGLGIGAASAIGGAALLAKAAQMANVQLPDVVKQFAPIAGAGVVAGLSRLSPKFKGVAVPALIGGALVVAAAMFMPKAAGNYRLLRGAGNVARSLTNGARGAGNVARSLTAAVA